MLILIAHGETLLDQEGRFNGSSDTPLSELGKIQAIDAGKLLSNTPLDVVFASRLGRSKATAWAIVGEQKRPPDAIHMDEAALNERSFGLIDGLTLGEARGKFPPKKYKVWERDLFEAPPMGESLSDVMDRMVTFYKLRVFPLLKKGKRVCLVGHPIGVKMLLGWLNRLDEQELLEMQIEPVIPYEFSLSVLGIQ